MSVRPFDIAAVRVAVRALVLASVLVALPLAPAVAELRVLLAFDASGHRVHRVVRLDPAGRALSSFTPPPASVSVAAAAGDATLTWLDRDGRTLTVDRAADPRVGHVPVSGADASSGGSAARIEGGWLVRGPDEAVTLLLRLPDREEPALSAEEWRLSLDTKDSPLR